MLSERSRNYIVGLTMIAAIAVFMVAVFKLSNLVAFAHGRPYTVTITAPNAGGVVDGTTVNFNGVPIGTVSQVNLSADLTHVELLLSINPNIQIPANAIVSAGKPPTIGAAYVAFNLPEGTAATAGKTTYLATDGTARLAAETVDSGLIPRKTTDALTSAAEEITALAKSLTAATDGLKDLLAKRTLAEYEAQDPKMRTANISILVQRLDGFVHNMDSLVSDKETLDRFHQIMKNLEDSSSQLTDLMAQAKASLKSANGTLDKFGGSADQISAAATQASATLRTTETQIVRTTEQLSMSLASLNTMLSNINKGQGTAGRLVNDPRLYDGLVDLTTSLKQTSDDLNTLVQKWKEEGLPLHLK